MTKEELEQYATEVGLLPLVPGLPVELSILSLYKMAGLCIEHGWSDEVTWRYVDTAARVQAKAVAEKAEITASRTRAEYIANERLFGNPLFEENS